VASVSGETPPPPQPTGFKEAEPEAPQPMTTEKPAPPPRATAVEESDKAADAAPPEAAPSPGADSTAPAMAEDKTELKSAEETMSEAKTAVEEKPMAKAPQAPSAPELPKTPEVAKTEPTAPAAKEPADTTSSGSQTASLPRAGTGIDERLLFDTDQDELTDEMRNQLSDIAKTLLADESQRIELRGYADAAGNNAGAARRVSLKRAVSVRRYLMDQGVRSTRIDVRALGDKDETGGPPDRVDLILSQ
jgi:outer membrane protein OmpA-like peptidoglycan-associated protein